MTHTLTLYTTRYSRSIHQPLRKKLSKITNFFFCFRPTKDHVVKIIISSSSSFILPPIQLHFQEWACFLSIDHFICFQLFFSSYYLPENFWAFWPLIWIYLMVLLVLSYLILYLSYLILYLYLSYLIFPYTCLWSRQFVVSFLFVSKSLFGRSPPPNHFLLL